MSLFPGEVLIKRIIEVAIDDLKKNEWIIQDIFSDFIENPLLEKIYGYKEIDNAIKFIKNTRINFYLNLRMDNVEFPAITINLSSSQEARDLATLADSDYCVKEYTPEEINKPINYIVKPSNIVNYDNITGIIQLEENVQDFQYVRKNMIAINPDNGNGWVILDVLSNNRIKIIENANANFSKIGIIPQYQIYRARRERIISREDYQIGCHSTDPSTLLFLYSLVKYALLRYREGLLEHHNFQLSNISATDMISNPNFGADNIYSKWINIQGQVEERWIKTPFRIIETVGIEDCLGQSGIKICSNKDTDFNTIEGDNDLWTTINNSDK
jgi:hypothetical protein